MLQWTSASLSWAHLNAEPITHMHVCVCVISSTVGQKAGSQNSLLQQGNESRVVEERTAGEVLLEQRPQCTEALSRDVLRGRHSWPKERAQHTDPPVEAALQAEGKLGPLSASSWILQWNCFEVSKGAVSRLFILSILKIFEKEILHRKDSCKGQCFFPLKHLGVWNICISLFWPQGNSCKSSNAS